MFYHFLAPFRFAQWSFTRQYAFELILTVTMTFTLLFITPLSLTMLFSDTIGAHGCSFFFSLSLFCS